MQIIQTAQVVASFLPILSNIVLNVEAAAMADNTAQGTGAAKLQLALDIFKSIYNASNPPFTFEQIQNQAIAAINAWVVFYNTIKAVVNGVQLFGKTAPVAKAA